MPCNSRQNRIEYLSTRGARQALARPAHGELALRLDRAAPRVARAGRATTPASLPAATAADLGQLPALEEALVTRVALAALVDGLVEADALWDGPGRRRGGRRRRVGGSGWLFSGLVRIHDINFHF